MMGDPCQVLTFIPPGDPISRHNNCRMYEAFATFYHYSVVLQIITYALILVLWYSNHGETSNSGALEKVVVILILG